MSPAAGLKQSEVIGVLHAQDIYAVLVGTHQVAFAGSGLVIGDGGVLDEQVRITEIDHASRRELVLSAERDPGTVVVRNACGAVRIGNGRLVVSHTDARRPLLVIVMARTQGDTPCV